MADLILRAPAKINLTLEVLARRDDGYHGVRSVMVPLELADEMLVSPNPEFLFTCDRGELQDESNLAVIALRALGALPAIRMDLRKRIPVQAGLGGGSSDAAAVLRAGMDGAFGPMPGRDWLAMARSLGSDVPFFLAGTGALVEGTGERVTPVGALPAWYVLVVKPPVAVSTAQAYRALDASPRPQRPRDASVSLAAVEALQRADFERVESLLPNDFHEIAAGMPEIRTALDALAGAGAKNALLAGSGSCVFALAPDRARAEEIARRLDLRPSYERWVSAFAPTPDWRA